MPRPWADLALWAREHSYAGCELRNMLAWLEDAGVARAFVRGDIHGWTRAAPRPQEHSRSVVLPFLRR